MQRIFRVIKKKRNLRRLSAVWLFLILVELFCPALCETQTFAAESNFPRTEMNLSTNQKREAAKTSLAACDHQDQNHQQTVCNDECLCHATAIPSLGIAGLKDPFFSREQIVFRTSTPYTNSLSPPHLPPKIF